MNQRLLVMNMGSTSTKVAVYDGQSQVWRETIEHSRDEITQYLHFMDQYDFRKEKILDLLKEKGENLAEFRAFVSRGGTVRPIPGGVWRLDQAMLDDCQSGVYGDHPCNIGGQIAHDLAAEYGKEALTVDPPICSEMCTEARYSGLPEMTRLASFQQLNHRAIAKRFANDIDTPYEDLDLIVVHMGGGISVAAHAKGKIRDVNNALAGDGPFAPERSGGLPIGELIKLCYSGKYSMDELLRRCNGRGGMYAYLGIADGRLAQEMIDNGNVEADNVTKAMAYQVAKEVGALATAYFGGKLDAIIFTAGLAHWKYFVDLVREKVEFLAPVHLYPGENEMESLAFGVLRYLNGDEPAQEFDNTVDYE